MSKIHWLRSALTLFGAAWLASAPASHAADGPMNQSYAVLSIIGDKMTMVTYRPSVGSNLDRNSHQEVPVNDAAFDNIALLAVDEAIKRVDPQATTTLLTVTHGAVYRLSDAMLDRPDDSSALLGAIKGMLQKSQATRLILVTKHRGDALLKAESGSVGSGKLAGIGFYVDEVKPTYIRNTGKTGIGFVSPYAYLAVNLIDVASMKPIRRIVATESITVSTAQAKNSMRPWDALSSKEKFDSLETLIRKGIDRAVPQVLAAQ